MRTGKTLIRLSGCPSWSESPLAAQSLRWFCHVSAHLWWYCWRELTCFRVGLKTGFNTKSDNVFAQLCFFFSGWYTNLILMIWSYSYLNVVWRAKLLKESVSHLTLKRERSCMVSDSVHISHNVAYVVCTYWCHIKESCNICCLYICCAHDTIIEG